MAITKKYAPLLLIPIGFGPILANLPLAEMGSYGEGIKTELLPPVIFLGVSVLTDFRPLLGRPLTFLPGAAATMDAGRFLILSTISILVIGSATAAGVFLALLGG